MDILDLYNNRIRDKLLFEGVENEMVRKHYDLYNEYGYTGFIWRTERELSDIFGKNWRAETDYVLYIMDRSEARLEEKASRFFIGLIEALT